MTQTYRPLPNALELELFAVRIAETDAQHAFNGTDQAWCAIVVADDGTKVHPLWSDLIGLAYVEGMEWFGLVRGPDGTICLDSDRGADFADWLRAEGTDGDYGAVGFHTHCLAWAAKGSPTKVNVWRSRFDLRTYQVLPRER